MNPLGKLVIFLIIGLALSKRTQNVYPLDDNEEELEENEPDYLTSQELSDIKEIHKRQNNMMLGQDDSEYYSKAMAQFQSSVEVIQNECIRHGKKSIANSLKVKSENALACIKQKSDLKVMQQEITRAAQSGSPTKVFDIICNIWPNIHNCLRPLFSDTKHCLDKVNNTAMDKTIKIFDESNTFFCENNQQHIMDFIQERGVQCFQSQKIQIMGCVNTVVEERQMNPKKVSIIYDDKDCSDIRTLRSCIVSKMYECENMAPDKIVDEYLGMVQGIVCNSAVALTCVSALKIILLLIFIII